MSFIKEARTRLNSETPPFFRKLQKAGAIITGTGASVALIPGALNPGLITMAIGLTCTLVATFACKDTSQTQI